MPRPLTAPASARLLAIALAVAVLAAGTPDRARAAARLSWKQAVSGNAGVAGNWTPSQVPAASDTGAFNVAGTYTVTFDATVPSLAFQTYKKGVVTMTTTGHTIGSFLRVGEVNADVGTFSLTTGQLNVGSDVTIGVVGGSTGTVNVNDDDAILHQNGTTADVAVGNLGTGTLNVTGGGLVDAADDVFVGLAAGSSGTLLVSGVNASPVKRSIVTSRGADGDLVFGSNGAASVTIAAGGQAVATDDVRIALTSASTAQVVVDGFSSPFSSQLTVTDDLDIANNTILSLASGTGSVTLQNSGRVEVLGSTRVGDPDGGTGTLSIRPTTFFTTHDLIVENTHGVLDFQGGTLFVDGGLFDPPGTTLILDHAQFESAQLKNGATATFDGGSSVGYSVILGETHGGGLRLETGSHLTHVNGVLAIGLAPGANGTLDMTGNALLDGAGMIIVGQGGMGELNIGSGADLSLTEMSAAYSAGSNGFVDVAGTGTTLTLGTLAIGGHSFTSGGTAYVGVHDDAHLDVLGPGSTPLRVHPGGILNVGVNAVVTSANNIDDWGRISLAGSQVTAGTLTLQPDGRLAGFGTCTANVNVGETGVIEASGGLLTLGNASSDKGFASSGTLICGSQVSLLDTDGVTLGNVVLAGGGLSVPSVGGGTLLAGKTLSGAGLVGGTITNQGILSPGSSAGQITIQGNYIQGAGGKMTMEIGDAPTVQHDRLVVTAHMIIAGTLDVRILPGFAPSPGEDFTLIQCGTRSGTFGTVTLRGQPLNGEFSVIYNATSVVLHVNQITVDVPPVVDLPRDLSFVGWSGSSSVAGFELALPEASRVVVRMYSSAGRFVGTLFDDDVRAGVLPLRLREHLPGLTSGVYFGRATVRTETHELTRTAKVTLVR